MEYNREDINNAKPFFEKEISDIYGDDTDFRYGSVGTSGVYSYINTKGLKNSFDVTDYFKRHIETQRIKRKITERNNKINSILNG